MEKYSINNYLNFLLDNSEFIGEIPENFKIPEDYVESIKYCIENFFPSLFADVIKLRYFNDSGKLMSYRETAEKINVLYNLDSIQHSTIISYLIRIRKKLRKNEKCKYILFNGLKKYNEQII